MKEFILVVFIFGDYPSVDKYPMDNEIQCQEVLEAVVMSDTDTTGMTLTCEKSNG